MAVSIKALKNEIEDPDLSVKGCVYIATNLTNGKVYIGKTIRTLKTRRDAHIQQAMKGSNLYFHASVRKYGKQCFSWKVLFHSNDEKELLEKERFYISQYKSNVHGIGYNLTSGGEGFSSGTYGYIIIKELLKHYKDVYDARGWALRYWFNVLKPKLDKKKKPLPEGKVPYLIIIMKHIWDMLDKLEKAYSCIDDVNAKYHVEGFYNSVVKVASNAN